MKYLLALVLVLVLSSAAAAQATDPPKINPDTSPLSVICPRYPSPYWQQQHHKSVVRKSLRGLVRTTKRTGEAGRYTICVRIYYHPRDTPFGFRLSKLYYQIMDGEEILHHEEFDVRWAEDLRQIKEHYLQAIDQIATNP